MGLNDNLIEDYRSVITNTVLENELLFKVLSNDGADCDNPDDLLWDRIIPQQYVPDTITETGSYIFYDLNEDVFYNGNSKLATYTELTLLFWIFTHKDMPKYQGRLRNDILARELRYMFNDVGNMGIAKNHLLYNHIYNGGNHKYMGRVMAFRITDFSDKVRLKYSENKPNRA